MKKSKLDDDANKILAYFTDHHFSVNDITMDNNKVIITIIWGDWKHDHLLCKRLMNELGYSLLYDEVTEEDGSDTYSAKHYYQKVL